MQGSVSYKKTLAPEVAAARELTREDPNRGPPPMDVELLKKTRAEYKTNKQRKQEKWYDWTEGGDALDQHVRARREQDPVPFDIRRSPDGKARATTPYNKRLEDMEKSPAAAAEMFAETSKQAEAMAKRKYRPTSIFGGQQVVAGPPGAGWNSHFGFQQPEPAEAMRNRNTMAKYATSSFPSKYEDYCNKVRIAHPCGGGDSNFRSLQRARPDIKLAQNVACCSCSFCPFQEYGRMSRKAVGM